MATKKTIGMALFTTLLGIAAVAGLMCLISTASAASRDTYPPGCCPQIIGDQFYVQGQRYLIQGLNYYEKDHAWDLFWPYWHDEGNRANVAHELDIARDLGANTLRIFLRWDDFNTSPDDPAVPLEARRDLDELLDLAAARQMRVLLTLFDGMPNEGTGSLYRIENHGVSTAHLNSLLEPFTNTRGFSVDFSTDCRILAWDVKNEPDRDYYKDANGDGNPGTPEDREAVQTWVTKTIKHLREKDLCHPITVGVYGAVDGVYSPTIIGYYTMTVDFLSMHYSLDEKNFPDAVDAVEALAGGKPIVVEEFALHTWADYPTDTHRLRDQAAYYNAILSTSEADHLAGSMFWTLTDFSYIMAGNEEKERHQGILHNASVTTTEVPTPTDYSEKPAAAVVQEHFKPLVVYLDTFDGYALFTNDNCDPPVGWTDNRTENGAVIMTCDPAAHDSAPSEIGQARLTKLGGPDGVITSPVLETVTVDLSPQLVVDILTYTVRSIHNVGSINLDIGVKATDEVTPTWLATDLTDSSVDLTAGLKLPQTVYVPLPVRWPMEQDFQIIFRLQDHVPGDTGYSSGFEFGSTKIGACPPTPPPSVTLEGGFQKLFKDDFNGRSIDPTKWDIIHGNPYLFNCGVVLTTTRIPGVPSKTELRSRRLFEPDSMLIIRATTQNWQGENKEGDTSFGFERWYTNCHNAVIVTSDGQLGLIRPEEGVDCSQPDPPTRECYLGIRDWATLRKQPHEFAILWISTGVTLSIDGVSNVTSAECITPAIPQIPLHIRLNANVFDEDLPGKGTQYDQDVLWIDYLYVPRYVLYLPVILKNAVFLP